MERLIWLDTHAHVSGYSPEGRPREALAKHLQEVLDREPEVELRFVLSPDGVELERLRAEPEGQFRAAQFISQLVQQLPGRVYGACCVNPHYLDEALRTMDWCMENGGFCLVGELLQYMLDFRLNSPAVERIVRQAQQGGLPVHVHISTSNSPQGSFSSGEEELEDFCALYERVPQARYILAHFVGTLKQPPVVERYLDLLESRFGCFPDNVWVEIRDFHSPGVPIALARIPQSRLLCGTDWLTRVGPPFLPYGVVFGVSSVAENPYPPKVASLMAFLRQAGASEDTIRLIAWENARQLLALTF